MLYPVSKGAFLWLLTLCAVFGCAGKQIPYDVIQYVNRDIFNISQIETNALKAYASVTGENYTTDERVHDALKSTVVPYYKRFSELLREISPDTDELRRIHSFYVRGAETMYNGFRIKMLGIEKKDENLIQMADHQIISGRKETFKWKAELDILFQKSAVAKR